MIIRDLTFQVKPSNNLLIKGPSGSGKTSIFRLLSGIWPLQNGTITKPSHREIFYIPQCPYFPVGTLQEQIIYPMTLQQFKNDGHHGEDLLKHLLTNRSMKCFFCWPLSLCCLDFEDREDGESLNISEASD